jgi:hypothetical protein
MLAQPAFAQTLPGIPGAGSITVSSGGAQPVITAPNGNTLDIDLNAPRTVINWASLHVSGADTMNFNFDAASDLVLNKTTTQIAIDAGGTVAGKVGAATGGNIWFYSPQGVIVSPGAVMTAGGFLFSRGSAIGDVGFVDAGDPLAFLRAAADSLIRIDTITAATNASISASGDVVLSAATGNINAEIVVGAGSATVTATTGNLSVDEMRANGGAANANAGGAGATVITLSASTNASVISNGNTSVNNATTTTGNVTVQGGAVASLSLANSGRDVFQSAPQVFTGTIDAVRDVFITGTTGGATVTNRIFAGDDIEVTATTGAVAAGGATLRATGLGASDDAHVLVRSTGSSVTVNAAQTQGTGAAAGDVTISAATSASLTALSASSSSSRDLSVSGATASLTNGSAARDVFVSAITGDATVVTQAVAGDDVEVTTVGGNVVATGATLRSTGLGTGGSDGHVLAQSMSGTVNIGAATTQGTGAAAGDVTIDAATTSTLGTGNSSRDLTVEGVTANLTNGTAARDLFVTATSGGATVVTAATAGDDVRVTATSGAISAGGATLTSTGVGATDDASILIRSTGAAVSFGTAITQGTGVAAGDVVIASLDPTVGTSAQASRDVSVTGAFGISLESATAERDITLFATVGDVALGQAVLTGTGAGHDLLVMGDGAVTFGAPDVSSITTANTFSRTGGNTGTAVVRSLTGNARVYLDTSAAIDTLSGQNIDVTINNGPVTFGTLTAQNNLAVWAMDGALNVGDAIAYNGDLELNAYGGAMTVGTINAPSGNLGLYAYDDALTVTGSVHGGGQTQLQSFGLLDGTLASLISSDGALQLFGGQVDVGSLQAVGVILVGADDGNIDVQSAVSNVGISIAAFDGDIFADVLEGDTGVGVQATGDVLINSAKANTAGGLVFVDAGGDAVVNLAEAKGANGTVEVNAFGNATLRAAEATDGILVYAMDTGKATFGADDATSITSANYALTAAGSGCGCSPAPDGLQVFSEFGDAAINAYSISNPIALAASGEFNNLTVALQTGNLKIDELAGYNIMLEAKAGTLETVASNSGGGDYTITAHDFLGDALTPTLVTGLIRDVTITDTLGGLNLGTTAIHADRLLHITALNGAVTSLGQLDAGLGAGAHDGEVNVAADAMTLAAVQSDGDVGLSAGTGGVNLGSVVHADRLLSIIALNGAVTGAGQLDAGSGTTFGDVQVTADAIALDTVRANRDVNLNAGTGLVNVATSLSVDRTYALIGGDFSAAALAPLGAKAGTWTILDQAGDFDFSGKTLHYGSSIAVNVFNGDVIGGDITSDTGLVFVQADGGSLGALYGGGGQVTAIGDVGGMAVGSAQGVTRITVTAVNGTASLGSAILTGPGIHGLTVRATNGDVVLGAATQGAITSGNVVTSTGSSIALAVTAPTGKVDINLDHTTNANLTTVSALNDVKIKVVNGSQRIGAVTSTTGAVTINGPTGALTVDQLTAHSTSRITGIGDTRLVAADADAQLTVHSLVGALRLGDGTPGRVIDVAGGLTLQAFTDIVQEQGVLRANTLNVIARSGATLLGDNLIPNLNMVTVSAGDFAYHGAGNFTLQDVVNVRAGTVDLRSDGTIGQNLAGVILAQKLTGSSVGAANFRAANEVVELGDFTNTTGLFRFNNSRSLTVSGTVLSTGTLSIASHGGMTIAGTGTVRANGAGDAVVLASDGVFTNARGADAVTAASAGGRWLIYTQAFGDPQGSTAGNTFNGLVGKSFYGAPYDFAASGFTAGLGNGNRFVYAYQPTITVTPDSRTVTYSGAIPSLSATVTGLVNGDLFTDAWTGALVISGATSKNVGTYTLSAVTGGLTSDLNYAFAAGPAGSLRIDPKALSGVLAAANKTYDGTATASGSIGLTGVVAGETVSASGTYAFADKNAGTGKTVTASGVALSGADAGNYTLVPLTATQADILKKSLTGALTAANKTYDGTTAASGSIGLTGAVAGDTVSASGTYAFVDKNAGTGKTVTVSVAALTGLDAANYDLGGVSGGLADILRRQVTVAADSAFKPFGLVDPTLTYRITVGDLAAGDAFTGGLARDPGEVPGGYGITLGTLGLSTNYDLTFTGAVFTIRPFPSNEAGGSMTLKHLIQSPDFTLDWDPEANLTTGGQACPGEGCSPPAAISDSGGGRAVAALR